MKPVPNATPYITTILGASQAKTRMVLAELSDAERIHARQIAASQRCPIGEAAEIVRRSRR